MVTRINRFFRTIFIFYRGFWVPASLITIFCCIGLFSATFAQLKEHKEFYGILMFMPTFFWIKTITDILILLYLVRYKANELYFYFNLGVGKTTLWITTFIIDYLIFFLALYLTGLIFGLLILSSR